MTSYIAAKHIDPMLSTAVCVDLHEVMISRLIDIKLPWQDIALLSVQLPEVCFAQQIL